MTDLAKKFGIPSSLVDYIKQIQTEETEYQAKVKALMAKKGIKSLGDLTPDEKKKFFSQLDAAHQAKNEEVEPIQEAPKKPVSKPTNDDEEGSAPTNGTKTFLVKFEKEGRVTVRNYTGKSEMDVRSRAKVDAVRMKMSVSSVRLREEYEQEILSQDIGESFNDAQIAKLKSEYGKINTIDPSSSNYKKLIAMLDRLSKPDLEKLAGAGIKFISGLAKNRVNRMKNESVSEENNSKEVSNCAPKNEAYPGHIQKGKELDAATKKIQSNLDKRIKVVDKKDAKKNKNEEAEMKGDDPCWDGYQMVGTKKKNGKEVPNCVPKNEEVEIEEGKNDYDIYHKDFSTAVQHAWKQAEKRGFQVDKDDWDRKVAMGPRKPSEGKTNSYSITLMDKNGKPVKKALHMQVYNKGGQNPYELNMYVEEVQIDEAEEFKQGGKPLAKKFEKAFAKLGVRAKIKMKTVGNISVNEKKDEDKDGEENGKKKTVKKGEPLGGKKEPVEVNPEISDK